MRNKFSLLFGFFLIACSGGSDDGEEINNSCPLTGIETGECPTGDFSTLVWQDEFDGNAVNSTTWRYAIGDGCPDICGWGNNEQQYYTNRPSNVQVQNGSLKILREEKTTKTKTLLPLVYSLKIVLSSNMDVLKSAQNYLRDRGTWPALWLLGSNIDAVSCLPVVKSISWSMEMDHEDLFHLLFIYKTPMEITVMYAEIKPLENEASAHLQNGLERKQN